MSVVPIESTNARLARVLEVFRDAAERRDAAGALFYAVRCPIPHALEYAEDLLAVRPRADGGVALDCPAGCPPREICRRVGLKLKELGPGAGAPEPSRIAQLRAFAYAKRLTDTGNAERFAQQHFRDARYSAEWRRWVLWDGRRWVKDLSGKVTQLAKATVLRLYAEAANTLDDAEREKLARHAAGSDRAQRIAAMVTLAESEAGIPVSADDFNRNPWLLNVANGTLDLRSGQLHLHERRDLITKLVPIDWDPRAECPRWEAFLERIFAGDRALIQFLQRAVGYSLTGLTTEQCFFLLHGTGDNGKSKFLEAVRGVLGEYAMQADFTTFLVRKREGPRDDIARLFGSRLVTASEGNEGRAFDEALVKHLTGGDRVTARELFENSFEFTPEFKIWLATNHKPAVRGTDRGIWRRIRLIPFAVQIPEAERDQHLGEKLAAELPGILAWAVAGCQLWQRQGLGVPVVVQQATEAYRAEMDVLGAFLSECCELASGYSCGATELYLTYKQWSDSSGHRYDSQTAFGRKLSDRGFGACIPNGAKHKHRIGLRLRPDLPESFRPFRPFSGNFQESQSHEGECRKNRRELSEPSAQPDLHEEAF